MKAIVNEAINRKSGARGLRSILEEIMLDIMYELPDLEDVTECVITEGVVVNGDRPEPVLKSKAPRSTPVRQSVSILPKAKLTVYKPDINSHLPETFIVIEST